MHLIPDLPGVRHALVVATSTYTDPALARLRAPAQDAIDMMDVLADPAIGGFMVTSVIDRPEHKIRRVIDAFLAERGTRDLALVYLSCHGVLNARGQLYFATNDTVKTRLGSTAVESSWLLDRLEECRARRQVLILDCCFSGAFAGTKADMGLDLERRLIGAGRGRAVLTASRASEYSHEGAPLPSATNRSVFTSALVDGIRSGDADIDRDGYISVDDAFTYAADQVQATGGAQSPQRWLYGAEGKIILARNPSGVPTAAATPADTSVYASRTPPPPVEPSQSIRHGPIRPTARTPARRRAPNSPRDQQVDYTDPTAAGRSRRWVLGVVLVAQLSIIGLWGIDVVPPTIKWLGTLILLATLPFSRFFVRQRERRR